MKINLEIPDNILELDQEFYIHNVMKLVAIRRGEKWYVKTADCNRCGDCCRGLPSGFPDEYKNEKGDCKYLTEDNLCSMGIHRPHSCLMDFHDDPNLKPKRCTENFEEIA